ncbi:MAG: hypothetical protein K1060chlam1_01039 [Candidatus Anoxychlamydiales bacterium]|nr:hypothetical protein [Candidatus Anoxychlamydiales bacterium]
MKKLLLFISMILVLNGCFKNPIKTGAISEENRINLSSLAIGMTQQQVLDTMGYPYKTEEKISQNKIYEVWYYITERTLLGQSKLITRNFTPVVFEAGHLIGWGSNFYKYIFNIDDERQKREEEKRQKYTDDKEEWPKNEHTMIAPLNAQKSTKAPSKDPATTAPVSSTTETTTTAGKTDSKDDTKKTDEKTSATTEVDGSQEKPTSSESKEVFQKKPSCCAKKAEKTNACDKCKTKTDCTKIDTSKAPCAAKKITPSTAKERDSTKEDKDKLSPCKDRKDSDDGYNFWE